MSFHNGDNRPPPTMAELKQASAEVDLCIGARWEQLAKESMQRWLTIAEMQELMRIMNTNRPRAS